MGTKSILLFLLVTVIQFTALKIAAQNSKKVTIGEFSDKKKYTLDTTNTNRYRNHRFVPKKGPITAYAAFENNFTVYKNDTVIGKAVFNATWAGKKGGWLQFFIYLPRNGTQAKSVEAYVLLKDVVDVQSEVEKAQAFSPPRYEQKKDTFNFNKTTMLLILGGLAFIFIVGYFSVYDRSIKGLGIYFGTYVVVFIILSIVASFVSDFGIAADSISFWFVYGVSLGISAWLHEWAYELFNPDGDAPKPPPLPDPPKEEVKILPNTQEFEKLVSQNEITVMPTGDIGQRAATTHGSAHFLSDERKERATVKNPQKGLWIGGGFFNNDEGNLLTIASPGSGKGAGLIIPNLLTERKYPHSFVVFDPKGTNAAITARYQKESGQRVIIIDPANIQKLNNASHGIASARFNPLDFIGTNIVKGCSQIANFLLPDDPKSDDRIWNLEARDLIQGILMHIMTSPKYEDQRNLVSLYKIFRQLSWEDILEQMIENDACDGRIFETAKKVIDLKSTSERSFGSVVFSTAEAINWLKEPELQDSVKQSDFNPADFAKGGITVYLCIPIDSVEIYATWGRLVIGQLLHANSRPSGFEKAWCYYLLDEFPTMGIFPEVIKALAFSREYKMRLWLFAQNLAQLDRIYTENQRNEIIGTCGIFQAFAVNEPTTTEYVSERLGKTTEYYMEDSNKKATYGTYTEWYWAEIKKDPRYKPAAKQPFETSSTNSLQRLLLHPDEVEKEEHIITISSIGRYRLRRWLYWKKPEDSLEAKYYNMMIKRADRNINYK